MTSTYFPCNRQAEKEAKDAKSEPKSSSSKTKTKKSVSKSASKPKIDIESEDEDVTPPPATSDVDLADDADFKVEADSDDEEQPKPAKSKSKSKTKAKKKAVVDEDEDSDADVKEGAEKDGEEAEAEVEEEQEEKKPKKAASARKQGGVQIPEFWPWEEAKKVFQKPDVIPADKVEVRLSSRSSFKLVLTVELADVGRQFFQNDSWNGKLRTWTGWSNFSWWRRDSSEPMQSLLLVSESDAETDVLPTAKTAYARVPRNSQNSSMRNNRAV